MDNEEIVKRFENHEMRLLRSEERICTLEQVQTQIQDLTITVHDLSISIKNLVEQMGEVSDRLNRIESEPVQTAKDIKKQVITYIVTAVLAYFIAKIS